MGLSSGAFPRYDRQGATANPLNVNLSWLQISPVAPAKDGQSDEKQSLQLAPRAATHSGNWNSAGIHMSGPSGGATRLATASTAEQAGSGD